MAETKRLTMSFLTDADKELNLTLDNPRPDLTRADVESAMQKAIDTQALIDSTGNTVSAIKDIYITTTTITALV